MGHKFGWQKLARKSAGERAAREGRYERRSGKKEIPVVMPFGKYQGKNIEDIPDDYFEWLLGIELSPHLRTALQGVQAKRVLQSRSQETGE